MSFIKYLKIQTSAVSALTMLVILATATSAYADFTIPDGTTATSTQTLTVNEIGLVEAGGSIETSSSNGVDIFNDNNSMKNNGSVSTIGGFNFGFRLFLANNNNIYNNGSVSTIGADARGFGIISSDNTNIYNKGGIFARGLATHAIIVDFVSSNTTLNIFGGSQIVGRIQFFSSNMVNISPEGAGTSSTLMFEGADSVNLLGDNMVNIGGLTGTYFVVDPTGPSVNGAMLSSLTGGLHDVPLGRTGGGSPKPTNVASTRVEPGMMSSSDDSQIWFSGFGSHRERDTDGSVLAYDHDYYGGVGGYEIANGRRSRIGFMAGYAFTDLATDFQSLYTNTHSGFIGTYGQVKFGGLNLDASLIAGYEQNDNNRIVVDNINGFENAEADYDSFFISPSATLSTQYNISENFVSRSSLTGIYSLGWYDSYTESGTTQSNLSIDDRLAHALIAKVKIEMAYLFSQTCEVSFHIGGRYRYTINNDVNASLSGVSFQYATSGDDTYVEALFGLNGRYAATDTLNTEYALSDGIETNISGNAGIEFIF
jgi:hypothetical protein